MKPSNRRQKAEMNGRYAEFVGAVYLQFKGYHMLARRYKTPLGEIDLIAKKRNMIIFVEVKWRKNLTTVLNAISKQNQIRIIRTASLWIANNPNYHSFDQRFDMMAFIPWRWPVHVKNVFETELN